MLKPRIARVLLGLCAAIALVPGPSFGQQQFPDKPIHLMLGYAAGGGMDYVARLFAPKLQEMLGVPIVVENRTGASELMAARPVQNAAPDGYTLWIGSGGALTQGPGVRTDLPYQTLKDFTPIALIAEGEAILMVRNDAPVKTMGDLVNYAKANPGKLNYGSAGIGSGSHLTVEYVLQLAGGSMTHIPYKGDVESTKDAMAGNVDFVMAMVQTATPLIKDGRLRPLAVTGPERVPAFPDLPTVAGAGVKELAGVGSYTFYGLMGPAGMPPALVQRLNEAFNKVAAMPDVSQKLREISLRPPGTSSAAFAEYLQKELAKWQQLRGKVNVGTN